MTPFPPEPVRLPTIARELPSPEEQAEIRKLFASDCPDCGHLAYNHQAEPPPDGRTCGACRSNPGALVGNPDRWQCSLTHYQIRALIEAGSPPCENHDDPVLCKWDPELGRIVPEAGCPRHDHALNGSAA